MKINIKFEPRDIWIGLYIDSKFDTYRCKYKIYVCLLPMLPIVISYSRLLTDEEAFGTIDEKI